MDIGRQRPLRRPERRHGVRLCHVYCPRFGWHARILEACNVAPRPPARTGRASQRLVLACPSEAATIVCVHGTLRHGIRIVASAGANRLSREDRLTATTSKYEAPATAPANQSSLSPLTPEEIVDRLRPSDPRISPDGSRVIFAVSPRSKACEKWTRSLW